MVRTKRTGPPQSFVRSVAVGVAAALPPAAAAEPPRRGRMRDGPGMRAAEVLYAACGTPGSGFASQLDERLGVAEVRGLLLVCRRWAELVRGWTLCLPGRRLGVDWRRLPHALERAGAVVERRRRAQAGPSGMPPGVARSLPFWLAGLRTLVVRGDLLVPTQSRAADQVTDCAITLPPLPALRTLVLALWAFERMALDVGRLPALSGLGISVQPGVTADPDAARLELEAGGAPLRHLALVTGAAMLVTFKKDGEVPAGLAAAARGLDTLAVAAGRADRTIALLGELGVRASWTGARPAVYALLDTPDERQQVLRAAGLGELLELPPSVKPRDGDPQAGDDMARFISGLSLGNM